MISAQLILGAHLVSTLMMAGLIWTIQLVHYPLFARVGPAEWVPYHEEHTRRISLLVIPLMCCELATAGWLALQPPPGIPAAAAWVGLGLVGWLWLVTAAIQVPQHTRLGERYQPELVGKLVAGNWLRTAAWSARGGLAVWFVALVPLQL